MTDRRPYLFLSLFLLVAFSFIADNPLENAIASLKKYVEELPQEKVYLHFNQPYYSTGDQIWFKAYVLAGPYHLPSPLSRTVYVELLDDRQKLVQQVRLYVQDGSASGDLFLNDTLPSGNYVIRAYSNWMRNFDEAYFFHRQVKVLNLNESVVRQPAKNNLDIQFFPEGGDWITDFKSKVAFKAIGQDGLGRKISGRIVDNSGSTVSEFKSNSFGMGFLSLIPQKGKQYKAIITETSQEIQLPQPLESGLSLWVTNSPDQPDIYVRIQNSSPNKKAYLLAQTRGVVCYGSIAQLSSPIIIVKISKKYFQTGVAQFTIFDEEGNPRAERLIFIDNEVALSIEVHPDKQTYAPREKITLTLQVSDHLGKPIASDLSLSVCDDGQITHDKNQETIYSYLYLSSELKGHIESPGYYFNSENTDRDEALDMLLMTQGWRRFIYKKGDEEPWPKPAFPIEKGLTIKGRLVDKFNNKPIAGGKVSYLSSYPHLTATTASTNSSGYFEIPNLVYFDSAHALMQGETNKGRKYVKFLLDSIPEFPATDHSFFFPLTQSNDAENDFVKGQKERAKINAAFDVDKKTILLDVVEVKGKKEIEPELNATQKLYGKGSNSVQVAGNPALENMQHPLQLLQGRVAGVQVSGSGVDWTVIIRGVSSISLSSNPLVMINSIPIDFNSLASINVRDIESVDIFKGAEAAMFGSRGAAGVIIFHTKTGGGIPYVIKDPPYNFNKAGYKPELQFYSPQYDVQKPEHVKPDKRTTLSWIPYLSTDSTGITTISFYNHDLETSVTGIVEGISSSGIPGTSSFRYEIKKK